MMRIPFTAPAVPEADILAPEDRTALMRRYADSEAARRLISVARILGIISLILLFSPFFISSQWTFLFALAGVFLLIATLVFYRIAARRAILRLMTATDAKTRAI